MLDCDFCEKISNIFRYASFTKKMELREYLHLFGPCYRGEFGCTCEDCVDYIFILVQYLLS